MYFSKSKYTSGIQCPKMLWMQRNMPEQFDPSCMNENVLATGNEVGDLAMGYYGLFVEVAFDPDDKDRFAKAAAQTQRLLDAGERTICEATFRLDNHYCMVDILRVRDDGSFDITEVKSSTSMKDVYYHDLAYQCWLVKRCGHRVASASLMHINSAYVRQGELDLRQLFSLDDHTDEIRAMMPHVAARADAIAAVADAETEPEVPLGLQCFQPYPCGYRQWCHRTLPSPNVFDIGRLQKKKAIALIERGIPGFEELLGDPDAFDSLSEKQQTQVLAEVNQLPPLIDKAEVASFLDSLTFPLYFLDFETFQEAVPSFDGQSPFEQVTSQYSLHWLEGPDAPLQHAEFLGETGADPRRAVAEALCRDIPRGACTLAWNQGFEKGRIRRMAELFPDLADHLMDIHNHIRDLMTPFQQGHIYLREMHGSCSIKAVLPALFPDDPQLNYHALEGVHNGGEAASAFRDLPKHAPEQQAVIREQLLRYCELDTLAMVRIWQWMRDNSGPDQPSLNS